MSKKEDSAASQIAGNTQLSAQSDLSGKTGNELEHIRDILFGNQARATETRLGDLEVRVEAIHQELLNTIREQNSATGDRLTTKIEESRKDQLNRLKRQDEQQTTFVNNTRDTLTAQINQQFQKLAADIEQNRQEFQETVDKITADLQKQYLDMQKTLQDGLNRLNADLSERLRAGQAESQQRDNDLRQELLTMAAWLDNKKATRIDLGHMLIEVGRQLQNDGDAASADTDTE